MKGIALETQYMRELGLRINVREMSFKKFFEGVRLEKNCGDWVWDKILEGTDLNENL